MLRFVDGLGGKGKEAIFFVLLSLTLPGSLAQSLTARTPEPETGRYFVYVSDKRIITVELASESKVILNYINLSDVIELIESQGFLVIDQQGVGYRGHLFQYEEVDPNRSRFFTNELVKPDEFSAFDLLGNFRFQSPPQRVFLQLGSKLAELEPIDSSEFDILAGKVSQLDFTLESKTALLEAGFWRGQGSIYLSGEEEHAVIQQKYPRSEPAPPVLLEAPKPRLLARYDDLPEPVVVQVKVQITDAGGILDPTIARGVNPELDELAIQVILNSWRFLPAIADGKPVGAETVLNVQFTK